MAKRYEGRYRVRRVNSAAHEASKLFRRARHREELRRHVLKLIWYPESAPSSGMAVDLDCESIKGVDAVHELRIDEIGQTRNIRVIFFVGDQSYLDPLPCIWILSVFAKKRDDFTSTQLRSFKLLRNAVRKQFYGVR